MARRRRPIGPAALVALGASALIVLSTAPALAANQDPDSFAYGKDQTAWYWKEQTEQEIAAGGTVDQRVRLPSPQASDTLPVAVQNGEMDKISALQLDLGYRGYEDGDLITKLAVTLAEGTSGNEPGHPPDSQPEYNVEGKSIQACLVTDVWAPQEADLWEPQPEGVRPNHDDGLCVSGIRAAEDPTKASWTFDLTAIAQAWSSGTAVNNGVMFVPVIPPDAGPQDQSWQINLKIPARDSDATPEDNEYDDTTSQFVVEFEHAPAPAESASTSTTGSTYSPYTPPPATGGYDYAPPSTTTTTTTTTSSGPGYGDGPGSGTARNVAAQGPPVRTVPRMPWYVWLLIPAGLVALGSIRSVILEPVSGPRAGGVIAAIRARNEQLRGTRPASATAHRAMPAAAPSLGELAGKWLGRARAFAMEALHWIRES